MSHSLACFYLRWEVCSGERARSLCSHAGVSCEKGIFQAGAKVSCLAGSAWERAYAGIILGSGVRLTYGLCRVPTHCYGEVSSCELTEPLIKHIMYYWNIAGEYNGSGHSGTGFFYCFAQRNDVEDATDGYLPLYQALASW